MKCRITAKGLLVMFCFYAEIIDSAIVGNVHNSTHEFAFWARQNTPVFNIISRYV